MLSSGESKVQDSVIENIFLSKKDGWRTKKERKALILFTGYVLAVVIGTGKGT